MSAVDKWGFPIAPERVECDADAVQFLTRERAIGQLQVDAGVLPPPTMAEKPEGETAEEWQEYIDSYDREDQERSHRRNVAYVAAFDRAIAALRVVPVEPRTDG